MYWIVTLIVGAVVGWLASILMKTNAQMGAIANIVVGIIGSSLGFWLAGVVGLSTGGPIVGWVVAVLGAALLIFILDRVTRPTIRSQVVRRPPRAGRDLRFRADTAV